MRQETKRPHRTMSNISKYINHTSKGVEASYDEVQVARFVPCKFTSVVELLYKAYTTVNNSDPLGVDELLLIEKDATVYVTEGTLPPYGRRYVDTH